MGVFSEFRRVDFVNGLGPLVEGLRVVLFGDEHDEFVELIGGGGEDLLEGREDAEDIEGGLFVDSRLFEVLFVGLFDNVLEGEEFLALKKVLHLLFVNV